jgi:hypothetical protein
MSHSNSRWHRALLALTLVWWAPAHADDADFARRCASPGVIKCIGFNNDTEVVRGQNLFPVFGTQTYRGSVDNVIRASGAGSLRFDVPQNVGTADMTGKFVESLGDEFGARNLARFQGKSRVYVQFRQRFTPEFTRSFNLGRLHFKQAAINNSDKCGDETIVTENSQGRGFPQVYGNCGATSFIKVVGGIDILQSNSQGASTLYWCRYTDQRNGDFSGCAMYRADQWITFYYEMEFGDEDQANSVIRAYIQYEGEPMRQFIDFTQYRADFDRPGENGQAYRSISLLPYVTGKTSSQANEAGSTWYDELIISRQPIPAPEGAASPVSVSLNANPTSVNQGGSSQLTWNSSNADSCAASGAWSGNKGLSGNEMVGPLSATSTFTLACSASGGASASRSVTVTVASSTPAPTVTFTANPTSVAVGGSSTLNWSSSNATSCTGSGGLSGWAGSKATSGSQSVGPFSVASTFTLACTGAGGTTQRTATVSLVAAPTVNLSANPTSVTSGNTTRLTWSSTNATGCAATGAWAGNKATSGNQTTAALTQTSTFTLACTGAGGTTSRSVTVNVTPAGPPPPGAPTVSLSANPTSVTSGGTSRLTWSSSNATGCAASGAWTGNKATSGNQMTAALTQTSTFTLACTGAGGTTSRSVTVNVTPPGAPPPGAPTVSLSASPMTVAVNGSTTLTWSSSNATTCTASDGWTGSKPMSGNETRTDLNDTTTFSLQCTGAGGSDGASVTVTVTPGGGGGGDDTTVDESGGGAIDWLLGSMLLGLLVHSRRRPVRPT